MNRFARASFALVMMGWAATAADAIVPPTTSLEASQPGMSAMEWFWYGSVMIVLGALLVTAVALILWLMRALFDPRFKKS